MTARRPSGAAVVWWGVAAVITVSMFLAPIRTVGWCAYASGGGGPVCSDLQESLLGIESTPWLWLCSVGAIAALTAVAVVVLARPRPRPRPAAEASGASSEQR